MQLLVEWFIGADVGIEADCWLINTNEAVFTWRINVYEITAKSLLNHTAVLEQA